jgi:hypothetical protein
MNAGREMWRCLADSWPYFCFLEVAGGLITPESQDAAPADKKFVGSVLLYEADSIEDVRKLVEQDIYWTENVVSWTTIPISWTLIAVP